MFGTPVLSGVDIQRIANRISGSRWSINVAVDPLAHGWGTAGPPISRAAGVRYLGGTTLQSGPQGGTEEALALLLLGDVEVGPPAMPIRRERLLLALARRERIVLIHDVIGALVRRRAAECSTGFLVEIAVPSVTNRDLQLKAAATLRGLREIFFTDGSHWLLLGADESLTDILRCSPGLAWLASGVVR